MNKFKFNYLFIFLILLSALSCQEAKKSFEDVINAKDTNSNEFADIQLNIMEGDFQIGAPSNLFSQPLKVQLLINNSPANSKQVSFAIASGAGGILNTGTVTTDSDGFAQVFFTASATPGITTIRARYLSASVDFSMETIDQTGNQITIINGNGQSQTAGSSLSNPLRVSVTKTAGGAPSENVLVRFDVISGNGRIDGSVNSKDVLTNGAGIALVNFDVGTISGANQVKVTIVADPAQNITFNATGIPGAINAGASTMTPAITGTLVADSTTTRLITVQLRDVYGNLIPTATSETIVFTPSAGTMDGIVTNNFDGTYEQTYRTPVGTASPTATIFATIGGTTIGQNVTIQLVSDAYALPQSSINIADASIIANGTSTSLVTLTLKDQFGTSIANGGETVIFSTDKGSLIGSVTDNGDGTYSQALQASTVTETATVTATVNAAPLGSSDSISFLPGAIDLSVSSISSTDTTLTPDGVDNATLVIQLKDSFANDIITDQGGTVTLSTNLGTIGTVSNNGDGTYQANFVSSLTAGIATISAQYNSANISNTTKIYMSAAATPPSTSNSKVEVLGSTLLPADGSTLATIKVTLYDGANQKFVDGGNSININTTTGTMIGAVVDNNDGSYTQTLKVSNTPTLNVTVSALVDGNPITETQNLTYYGNISLANSTLEALPSSVEADGVSETTIRLTARDVNGVAIPVGGETTISFATTHGSLLASIADNGNGKYTQQLRAPGSAVSATVNATFGGSNFSDTQAVEFYAAVNHAGLTITCANVSTYKDGPIIVDGGTLIMNTNSADGYCPNDFTFTSVIVKNNGVITHSTIGQGAQYFSLEFTAQSVQIDSSSQITATGKGMLQAAGSANMHLLPYSTGAANLNYGSPTGNASHGGTGSGLYTPNLTYGSFFEPTLPGTGHRYNGSWGYNYGGGVIKITVTDTLTIDGDILAEAQSRSGDNQAGSGGSVWINAQVIQGIGTIQADGSFYTGGSSHHDSAGGGGRIALYYDTAFGNFSYPTNIVGSVHAYGGTTPYGPVASPGTVFLKQTDQQYGDLIIDNGGNEASKTTMIYAPPSATPTSITSTTITLANHFQDRYDLGSFPYKNWYINPKVGVNSTPTFSDDPIFKITSGNENSISITDGDLLQNSPSGDNFEFILPLDNLQISGGAKIEVLNAKVLVMKGDLLNNDDTNVTITSTSKLDSRIEYNNANLDINLGGSTAPDFLVNQWKSLTIRNGTWNPTSTVEVENDLTIDAMTMTPAILRKSYTFNVGGNISIVNSSAIYQTQTSTTIGGEEYSLEMRSASFELDAGSTISAANKGYQTSAVQDTCRTQGNTQLGPGTSITHPLPGNNRFIGGPAHGGYGAQYNNIQSWGGNDTYGDFADPYWSGSSCWRDGTRTIGGGIIRIDAGSGNFDLSGTINANGQNSTSGGSYGAGASGGSVKITAGAIFGSGTISARGGGGTRFGAGGGRIAIYYTSLAGNFDSTGPILTNVIAGGGSGTTNNAAAGTIYLKKKSDQYGSMIINNEGLAFPTLTHSLHEWGTPLKHPGNIVTSTLNPTTAQLVSGFTENFIDTGYLASGSYYLNPNINQNGTKSFSDDTTYLITGHSNDTLTTAADMTSVATSSDTASVEVIFKNLEIIGNGSLSLPYGGRVRVLEGDVTSHDTTTISFGENGIKDNAIIDLGNVSNSTITLGTGSYTPLIQGTNVDVNINGFSGDLSELPATLNSLTISSGSPSSDSPLNVTNDVDVLTGSTPTFKTLLTIGGNLNIDGATLYSGSKDLTKSLDVTGDINLTNAGILRSVATEAPGGEEYRLYIKAENISVCPGCNINANATGYRVSSSPVTVTMPGNVEVYGAYTGTVAYTAAGGSYGGYAGAAGSGHKSNREYGNYVAPRGMGPAVTYNTVANGTGTGGGSIRLEVGTTLDNDGIISANASSSPKYVGAAGGSVMIETINLNGSGTISANGQDSNVYGGGSGGRIAVYFTNTEAASSFEYPANIIDNIQALPGAALNSPTPVEEAAGGTVYLFKNGSSVYGDLIFEGSGTSNDLGNELHGERIQFNTSDSLTSTTLTKTDAFAYWASPNGTHNATLNSSGLESRFKGLCINPNTAQNATDQISDDTLFRIASATKDTITIESGDMTSIASPGDTFQIVACLDNLHMKNFAHVKTGTSPLSTDIYVLDGDLDDSNFVMDGLLQANILDLTSGTIFNTNANTTNNVTVLCDSTGCN